MNNVPDVMPFLSGGGHNDPKSGACFMEMESFLAGEKWGADLQCAHPSLRAMAISVNDRCTDERRQELVHLLGRTINTRLEDKNENFRIALELCYWAFERFFELGQRARSEGSLHDATDFTLKQMQEVFNLIKESPEPPFIGNYVFPHPLVTEMFRMILSAKFDNALHIVTRTEALANATARLVDFIGDKWRPTFLADYFAEYDELAGRTTKVISEQEMAALAEDFSKVSQP